MEYIGHKSDDGVNREQALIEHLNGTSALCSEFARRFTMEEIGKLLGYIMMLESILLVFKNVFNRMGLK